MFIDALHSMSASQFGSHSFFKILIVNLGLLMSSKSLRQCSCTCVCACVCVSLILPCDELEKRGRTNSGQNSVLLPARNSKTANPQMPLNRPTHPPLAGKRHTNTHSTDSEEIPQSVGAQMSKTGGLRCFQMAPSIHPSISQVTLSRACSAVTVQASTNIGSGEAVKSETRTAVEGWGNNL